ncbi:MAG: polysaccharide deacetylase family protein [Clostridia bacterium]
MPFLVLKSKQIIFSIIAVLVCVLLAMNSTGTASAAVFFGYAPKKVPIYCVSTETKQVAISFDAAWGADKTDDIMVTLKEFNAGATFFLVGFWADKYGEKVKSIADNGFEIGTHSNTHPDMTKISDAQKLLELEESIKIIEANSGKKVELFRAPYGAYNNSLLKVAEDLSLKTIQWDVDSLDWKGLSAENIANRVVSNAKNGSIILCHNNADNIVKALPIILDRLIKKGFSITSVGNLLIKTDYSVDRTGMQFKKSA